MTAFRRGTRSSPRSSTQAFQFGIDELLREDRRDRQQSGGADLRKHHRGDGEVRRAARPRPVDVRGDDRQYVDARIVQALDKEWSPKLSAAYDEIKLNAKLFERIERLYEQRDPLGLDAKQMRLLTRTYEGFVRNGAKLNAAQKAQLSDYNQQLATAFSEFNSQLLADEGDLHAGDRGRDGRRSSTT